MLNVQKVFAGARVRRIRHSKGLTQTGMAEGLGISPSYLNLIERNQRPLTAQLILKLVSVYKVDPDELQTDAGASLANLREVFSDPLLSGELPGESELLDFADAAPNAAAALIKLYRAYREQAGRLTDLSDMLSREGRTAAISSARLPVDEVREVFECRSNHFPALEEEAEAFHRLLASGGDLLGVLKAWFVREHGISVRVLPAATMPTWRRRYDRHSQRLFISERLSPADQLREIAIEASLIRMRAAIAIEIDALKLHSDEAKRLARFELGRYAAHALMMPYEPFLAAAEKSRYDISVLAARFQVSFEQAANRLTTLGREGAAGVPFFLLEVDAAGNRLRRAGAQGFPQSRFGGGCPKLAIHAAFAQPGQILTDAVAMPNGDAFLTIARTVDGPQAAYHERPRRTALLLGCEAVHKDRIIYGASFSGNPNMATLIGPACRVCERQGCLARAEPPLTRPLGLDEMVTGFSVYDFQ